MPRPAVLTHRPSDDALRSGFSVPVRAVGGPALLDGCPIGDPL